MSEFTGNFVDLGPECFADVDAHVISWKGENYYKSCDEPVVTQPDGSGSHCVKRIDHPGDIHEDYDGNRKSEPKGRMLAVVSYPLAEDMDKGYQNTKAVMNVLRDVFADNPEIQVYAAIKESADQVIMILEGDG